MLQINIHEPKTSLSNFITEIVKDKNVFTSGKNQSLNISITNEDDFANQNLANESRAQEVSREFRSYNK